MRWPAIPKILEFDINGKQFWKTNFGHKLILENIFVAGSVEAILGWNAKFER